MVEVWVDHAVAPQGDTLVRLAHEHRAPLGIGVQGDGADSVIVLGVELPDGPGQAHGRFASLDYCNPLDHFPNPAWCRRIAYFRVTVDTTSRCAVHTGGTKVEKYFLAVGRHPEC